MKKLYYLGISGLLLFYFYFLAKAVRYDNSYLFIIAIPITIIILCIYIDIIKRIYNDNLEMFN